MRTIVIAGGTRGIGAALAGRLRDAGDRVLALGSADADLSSVRETVALIDRLPDRVDALVLAAGRFSRRRVVTAENVEGTFALGTLGRFVLAEGLRPALDRAGGPVILNLCGTGGMGSNRIHWDDLQLERGYTMLRAVAQGARTNDLLGVGFAGRDPATRVRYVLYNPLLVNSGMHRQFGQPGRALIGAAAAALGWSVGTAARRLHALLDDPPAAPLTALRRGRPVDLSSPEFDRADAARLYGVLDAMAREQTAG